MGVNKFVFEADPPSTANIPSSEILGVTVILLTCSYDGREFVRVGYYVNNEYVDETLQNEPPAKPVVEKVRRSILAEKPRVTRFAIKWDTEESAPAEFPPEQPDVDQEAADGEQYGAEEDEDDEEDEAEEGAEGVEGEASADAKAKAKVKGDDTEMEGVEGENGKAGNGKEEDEESDAGSEDLEAESEGDEEEDLEDEEGDGEGEGEQNGDVEMDDGTEGNNGNNNNAASSADAKKATPQDQQQQHQPDVMVH